MMMMIALYQSAVFDVVETLFDGASGLMLMLMLLKSACLSLELDLQVSRNRPKSKQDELEMMSTLMTGECTSRVSDLMLPTKN